MPSEPHHDQDPGSAVPAPPGSETDAHAADRAALDTALTVSLALVAGRVLLGPRAGLLAAAALTGAKLWKQHAGKRPPAAAPVPVPAPAPVAVPVPAPASVSVQEPEPSASPDLPVAPPSAAPAPAHSVSLEGAPSLVIAPAPAFASPPPPSVTETAPEPSTTWSFDKAPGTASPAAPVTLPGSPATVFSAFSSAPPPASPAPVSDPSPAPGFSGPSDSEPETPPAPVPGDHTAPPTGEVPSAASPLEDEPAGAETAPPSSGLPDRFRRPPPPPAPTDAAPDDADILEPSREAAAPDAPPASPPGSAPPARPQAPGRYWALVFLLLAGGAATILALDKDKLFPPGAPGDTAAPPERTAAPADTAPPVSRALPLPAPPQEAARAALDSLLAADSAEALLPVAQDPDFLPETLALYPPEALRPVTPRGVRYESAREMPDGTATAHLFRVETDAAPGGFPVAVEQRGADFRINWEAYVQCRDDLLARFLADPAPRPARLLVALRRETPAADPEGYRSCLLLPLTPGGSPAEAVVPVDSPFGRILTARTEPVQTYAPVVELTREHGRVIVTRLIRETWRAGAG